MGGRDRWAYMGQPGHNPPNDDCPDCTEPSKTYFIGAKTVFETQDGVEVKVSVTRHHCEHHHEWVTRETR